MLPVPSINSSTLASHPGGPAAAAVLHAALQAVDPSISVQAYLRREGDRLEISGQTCDLSGCLRVLLVAVGKAASPMARTAAEILGEFLTAGIVVTKDGHIHSADRADPRLSFYETGHPIPDERSVRAADRMLAC